MQEAGDSTVVGFAMNNTSILPGLGIKGRNNIVGAGGDGRDTRGEVVKLNVFVTAVDERIVSFSDSICYCVSLDFIQTSDALFDILFEQLVGVLRNQL